MNDLEVRVRAICQAHENNRTRLMDIVNAVQNEFGYVPGCALDAIAKECGTQRVAVQSLVSFYAFHSELPKGRHVIRLCNDIVDQFQDVQAVADAMVDEAGVPFGQTTPDNLLHLEWTPCIGMSDQAPAAIVDDVIFPRLTPAKAKALVKALKAGKSCAELAGRTGDGNNSHRLVKSAVHNNLRLRGDVIFADYHPGSGLAKALAMSPAEVVRDVKTSRLRGRGGAGFPTGMKWDFARQTDNRNKYVICNADEGEPGTFKDRVILTECPELLFDGMTIAGYATGSAHGILYLRAEYAYLKAFIEDLLAKRHKKGLLGKDVAGKTGFNFDIRIQMGAGAYICGEETALISSCEGRRGDPKNRPPFPAQKGYLECPTIVNNVETFCCAARILQEGPGWFAQKGSKGSPGTKLLSVSGDCEKPGVYEVPFGIQLQDLLEMVGADHPAAVQIGGPSGSLVGKAEFNRTICYDDLATGGSVMIFNQKRDVLKIAMYFLDFFIEESCGYCTPCRVGNVLIRERLGRFLNGTAESADLDYLTRLGTTVKFMSRCGMGQTSPNPVLTTLKNFPDAYRSRVKERKDKFQPTFDIGAALVDSQALAGRKSVHF
ncbi:MAG: NADH:ubiquinone oxidoreductase [Lentisphaerae bacterium RIFOXYC12_FULL_60_16]|nr:MAG: NADH:ubiquinone oxidoreductase [Lentisphaerae bacterium RIFOXYC12_FULL_60_16]OGV79349.1 MAG: NADH:ubiquinone oxidoreductase [Lentisphaerae bacterium RIFOXYB12_FULL_60_10]